MWLHDGDVCETCVSWEPKGLWGKSECRAELPVVLSGGHTCFPEMPANGWCRQHEYKNPNYMAVTGGGVGKG